MILSFLGIINIWRLVFWGGLQQTTAPADFEDLYPR